MEKKREEFRKYLDRTGAIDNLTKALIKLYEQKNKPQDSVKFLRNEMCEECHDEDQYQLLAADLEAANKRICELEREISKIKGSLRKSPSEMMLAISTGFEEMTLAASPDAIIRKVLTKELIDKAMELKTVFKGTLLDCIQSSLEYHESPVGAFACDHDAYEVFAELFNPIIEIMHDFTAVDKHPEMNWDESCKIPELDENFVKSVEISCIRNISDYPFASIMTLDHYDEIMKRFAGIVKCMCTGNLKGKFYGLDSIPTAARKSLLDSKILFTNDCPLLKAANVYRFWPNGRGVFINEMQNFYVWCNQTDHLKFFVKESGGNMRE